MAQSMDFPSSNKKKKYSDNTQNTLQIDPQMYIAVPGPQGQEGPRGPKGDTGPEGMQGPKGDKGDPGRDGKDGRSLLSPSEQNIGWALYDNLNKNEIRLGANKGSDGWVSFFVDGEGKYTNEKFLPKECNGLWVPVSKRINFKPLKIGSIITVRYNISLSTLSNNTEVWFRTLCSNEDTSPTNYVGILKYQFDYDISMEHTLFLEDRSMQIAGGIPQLRTDHDAIAVIKSIMVSVS